MFLARVKAASVLLFALALVGAWAGEPPGAPPSAAERLRRQLFTRTDQVGKPYEQEELEAPLGPHSRFLTASRHARMERLPAVVSLIVIPHQEKSPQQAAPATGLFSYRAICEGVSRGRPRSSSTWAALSVLIS
jgi:hypothetical protein